MLTRGEWLRLSGFGGAVLLLHGLGWGLFLYYSRHDSALAGLGFGDSPGILKTDEVSSITLWGNLLRRFDFVEAMRVRVAEADVSWTVGRLTALMLLVGAFSLAILSSASCRKVTTPCSPRRQRICQVVSASASRSRAPC